MVSGRLLRPECSARHHCDVDSFFGGSEIQKVFAEGFCIADNYFLFIFVVISGCRSVRWILRNISDSEEDYTGQITEPISQSNRKDVLQCISLLLKFIQVIESFRGLAWLRTSGRWVEFICEVMEGKNLHSDLQVAAIPSLLALRDLLAARLTATGHREWGRMVQSVSESMGGVKRART